MRPALNWTVRLGLSGWLAVVICASASGQAQPGKEKDRPANRLAKETSPYLLLHAHNPVDWYPWGPEAFAKAKTENKPIFLSVGYSSCYWCHVMERESFMDGEIAKVLNAATCASRSIGKSVLTSTRFTWPRFRPSGQEAGRCRCS